MSYNHAADARRIVPVRADGTIVDLSVNDPSGDIVAVTTSDTTNIRAGATTRGISVGGAGAVAVVTASGQTVTISSLAAGIIHPLKVSQVRTTGTTATGIMAYF